jgi:hypothetical protein
VLEKEYRNASRRLEETQVELNDLHPEKLKVGRVSSWPVCADVSCIIAVLWRSAVGAVLAGCA